MDIELSSLISTKNLRQMKKGKVFGSHHKFFQLLVIIFVYLGLSACGGSSSDTNIAAPISMDASLSGLSLSVGSINPMFVSSTTSYALTTSAASTTITATVNQVNATITVNGAVLASGSASTAIVLAPGDTVITIIVTAQDGSTTQTYTVTLTQHATDATLSSLSLSAGAISPEFTSAITAYSVNTTALKTTVTSVANQANATIQVNGTVVASGSASADIELVLGDTVITIVITAQDGSTSQTYIVTLSKDVTLNLELLDPTPGQNHGFGTSVVVLANDNIVVTDPNDSSLTNSGAVHLYSPLSSSPIASLYGDAANDQLGLDGITALANGNYVIASSLDDENGIVDAGSVRLMNGVTGQQIGATLAGDGANDLLGLSDIRVADIELIGASNITALANSNYVVVSKFDDENGVANAGSVRLMNGDTGVQIGTTLAGDVVNDQLGRNGVTALGNSNYVITTTNDDENGIVDAGSVRLVNGNTGEQIGSTLAGDQAGDSLGWNGITALANDNYVIGSSLDVENGISGGSVRLMDGNTGVQISMQVGAEAIADLGENIIALGNSNFVIASRDDNINIDLVGSVQLVSGITGALLGNKLSGDFPGDALGSDGITVLANNNYVITSSRDDVNGISDAGSIRVMNGNSGMQISILTGNVVGERLGAGTTTALANNNFVIASGFDDVNGTNDAGSVRLMNGAGQIGSTLAGDVEGDLLGINGITVLANNNYVIASGSDDENGIIDAGSVRLVDGSTGIQIGSTLAGDVERDFLGYSDQRIRSDRSGMADITVLANNNYVIISRFDDENGILNAGSVSLLSGSSNMPINTISGLASGDMNFASVIKPNNGDYYILSQALADKSGQLNSGMVRIVVP